MENCTLFSNKRSKPIKTNLSNDTSENFGKSVFHLIFYTGFVFCVLEGVDYNYEVKNVISYETENPGDLV